MASRRQLQEENLPKFVYYDLSIRSQTSDNENDRRQPLVFSEERGQPVVKSAEKYALSVTRFMIDTMGVPLFKGEIEPGSAQSDPNLMIQAINMDYFDGATLTTIPATNLVWTPRDLYESVPLAPSLNPPNFVQDIQTTYYDSYSYHHLVEMLNTAFATNMAALIAATGGGASPITGVDAPVAYWDSSSDKLEIRVRSDHFDKDLTNKVRLYFNRPLYSIYPNFDIVRNNFQITEKRYNQLVCSSNSGMSVESNFFGAFDAIVLKQEYSDLATISPYSSIVFTSTLPVLSNQMSAPYTMRDGNLTQIFSSVANQTLMITDITSQDYSFRSNILYNPSGEYRRLTLLGNNEISHIQISVWLLAKNGTLFPFYMYPNSSASMKILFERID